MNQQSGIEPLRSTGLDLQGFPATIAKDAVDWIEDYAKAKPMSLALWALGIGFVLGWKLKPW